MSDSAAKLLIVNESLDLHDWLRQLQGELGVTLLLASDVDEALTVLREQGASVMVAEPHLLGRDDCALLRQARRIDAQLPVLILSAHSRLQEAVRLVRAGAYDYRVWPAELQAVNAELGELLAQRCRPRQSGKPGLLELMGRSVAVQRLYAEVLRVAPTDFSVLIMGETGAGKEVVAQAVHQCSHRASEPLVEVDCGAIPENLIESELFGYEKGAFTGADRARPGRFEAAGRGTVFLDEISNLSLGMQNKLLRALQERRYYRVGGRTPIELHARVIAASNMNLNAAQGPTGFRVDLYHRLSEYTLVLPALRERKEDIAFLCRRFIELTSAELGKSVTGISPAALAVLLRYDWPGNVRELRNIVRRAVLWADRAVEPEHLGLRIPEPSSATFSAVQGETAAVGAPTHVMPLKEVLRLVCVAAEKQLLSQMVEKTGGNIAEVARLLAADYKTVHSKIKKYDIQHLRFAARRLAVAPIAVSVSSGVGPAVALR